MFLSIKKGVAAVLAGAAVLAAAVCAYGANMVRLDLIYDGVSHPYYAEEIKINVNGSQLSNFDIPPVSIDGRTLVPARAVFESLGASVTWNGNTQEVYIIQDNDVVVIQIDNPVGYVNGIPTQMDVAPKIINDRTMIPARYVAEALGYYVGWDDQTRTVTISEQSPTMPEDNTGTSQENTGSSGVSQGSSNNSYTSPTYTGAEIDITGVTVPSSLTSAQTFTITASGEIEKFQEVSVEGNRIVVDIYNATMRISNSNISVTTSPYVTAVRSAQNQVTPEKISRVVFDTTGEMDCSITLGTDKRSIVVSFTENYVNQLQYSSQGTVDTITLTGDVAPGVSISSQNYGRQLILDIPNAYSNLRSSYDAGGYHVDYIETSQYTDKTVRIVLELYETNYEYTTSISGNSTTITISKSTVENVSYDVASRTILLSNVEDLSADDIVHTDDYLNGRYILTLPGDYSHIFGYGTYRINDDYLSTIEIATSGDATTFTLNENKVIVCVLSESQDTISIQIKMPKEVYDRVVLVDAGHGGTDPGSSGNGLVEKNINLLIATKLYQNLEADGSFKVYATRLSDTYPTNPERAAMGNDVADLFISIHQNSVAGSTTPNGIEILYTSHSNEVSGHLTSRIAAQTIQNYLISATGAINRGIKDSPEIIVLNRSTTSAVLVECGFLTNPEEAAKLGTDAYQQLIADTIYEAIVDMFDQYPTR